MIRRSKAHQTITPITLIACKQRVGHEDADAIALPVLLHMDAAKRGQGPNAGQQFLYQHLVIASYVAARKQSRALHAVVTRGCDALMKASQRPTERLDLTTGEYKAIAAAITAYLRALPLLEVGLMNEACRAAEAFLNAIPVSAPHH